jgi:CHAT domain-containing protein
MFSALELGDARLSLLDLYDLELEVELAVLSGCGTGLSYVQGSDELVGLTRGLLFAGARSVLATLWEVNDESTADLMRLFYGRLATDPRPARALQHAMATLRQTHPHPYYWAPFVLTGRP